jgi:integrase/recombinase XerD
MPPRKGSRRGSARVIGDPGIEDGFGVWVGRYLEWLRVRNYSPRTIQSRESYLAFFVEWCEARSLDRPDQITRALLQRYQRHLYYLKKRDGAPLSPTGQQARLIPVRAFYGWLAKQTGLAENPATELELPRQGRRLPPAVLSHEEAECVMMQPDLGTPVGLRDRAVLETLYSSGVRRQELARLRLGDLDAERGTLFVRQGKG